MMRGNTSAHPRGRRLTRSAGVFSLVAGIVSAAALTGAAFYTVERSACADPAQYIRHDNHVELVGGCLGGTDLPGARPAAPHGAAADRGNYRP